jgi:hypothetical protein
MNEGINALIFYASVTALVAGTIRTLRASVERKTRDRAGIALAVAGCAGLAVATAAFLFGPRTALPF